MKSKNPHTRFYLTIMCLIVNGCTVGPSYEQPEPPLTATRSYEPADVTGNQEIPDNWWTIFKDPVLDELMQQAIDKNLTLETAQARMREAEAIYLSERGRNQPALNASANLDRMQMSENSRSGMMLRMGGEQTTTQLSGSLLASWELDIFGRNQYFAEAAEARLQSTRYAYVDLQNTVRAEIARQYYNLRGIEIQQSILDRNIGMIRRIVALENARFAAGTSSELKLTQSLQLQLAEEAKRPSLQAAWESSLLAMASLIPEDPNALRDTLRQQPFRTPSLNHLFGQAIPAELLRRRPDVRIAEEQLIAETAVLGIRATDLYPRFNLLGSLGQESIELGDVLNRASNFWNFGMGLSMPVFNGKRLHNLKQAQQAKVDQALSVYQATIIAAVRDTERAVIHVHYGKSEVERTRSLYENAIKAEQLADKQYRAGVIPLDQQIVLQQQLNEADQAFQLATIKLAGYLISLGQSLGGDWFDPQENKNPDPSSES